MSKYNNQYSWGGFFPDNIRKSIIKDCIESGDPISYFRVLRDVISDLESEWLETPEQKNAEDLFWVNLAKEL